jgi:hypothetical protein
MAVTLRDEARLLFLCAGPTENDERIAALSRSAIDWREVTRLAIAARAAPVLVRRITSALGSPFPSAAEGLRRLAMVEQFELLRMEERLEETLRAFHLAGVKTVLLKGAGLARTVYESLADRPMLDLDLLVPTADADAARAAALSAGWYWERQQRYDSFYESHHHLPPLSDACGTRALLELHTGLFPRGHPFDLDAAEVVDRSVPIIGHGWGAAAPSPEDHLVYLCCHWVWSHMMNGGSWRALRDVGALAERGGLDWQLCVERARQARATTCVYWTLRLARTLASIPVPATVLLLLKPPTPAFALERLERLFAWQVAGERACPSMRLSEALWALALRPGWSSHGGARPWRNPDLAAWWGVEHESRPLSARRLVDSLHFARAIVRA